MFDLLFSGMRTYKFNVHTISRNYEIINVEYTFTYIFMYYSIIDYSVLRLSRTRTNG